MGLKDKYRIRSIRKQRGMSGPELAAMLFISAQYYYDIEKGKRNLSADMAIKLADIFGVSVDYLLGRGELRKYSYPVLDEHNDIIAMAWDEEEAKRISDALEIRRKLEELCQSFKEGC